jgi:hypothetical protein
MTDLRRRTFGPHPTAQDWRAASKADIEQALAAEVVRRSPKLYAGYDADAVKFVRNTMGPTKWDLLLAAEARGLAPKGTYLYPDQRKSQHATKLRATATAVQHGSTGAAYGMAGGRSGNRPKTFPKRLQHGLYTATFEGFDDERFPGDTQTSAHWKITRRGKEVGTMHEGSYGWGRPTSTMRQLVWSGVMPPGESDPRSPEYGIAFDQGPSDSYAQALAKFAKAADRLIEWRQKHSPERAIKPRKKTMPSSHTLGQKSHATKAVNPEYRRKAKVAAQRADNAWLRGGLDEMDAELKWLRRNDADPVIISEFERLYHNQMRRELPAQ